MGDIEYTLGVNCGLTFAGLKAASLFWIKDGAELGYYRRCFAKKDFRFMVFKRGNGKSLYYVFHCGRLKEILFKRENREFLQSIGYEYNNVTGALTQLKRRVGANGAFPHEVGIFLGYPLEDVLGFIADAKGGVNIGGYWKVYCNLENKARLFARYDCCSRSICSKLCAGVPIEKLFKVN